ncbi:MAG TPA: ABC transporter substrate-binding protein, partial [Actinomycetota bacterium]|nr:ABC transporter substrate-binding protein [Actinomycetota bacterium]
RRWLGLAVVLVLMLAACDQGDGGAGDGGTEATGAEGGSADLPLDDWLSADLGACAEAPTGDPLTVGYAADLSELGGFADQPGTEAARFMAELINCSGGVDGRPVEVVIQDIQGDPEVTQRAAQDLLDAGVQAILGPPFADFGLPLLQVVGGQVPVLFVASTEPTLANAGELSFLVPFDDTAQATQAAEFALGQGFQTAVTFSSPGPYFGYNPEVFTGVFEEGGGQVLADYTFSLEDTDFSTQVNDLANLPETPDVLYTAMITPQLGPLLGQIDGAGIDLALIGADSFDATRVWDLGDLAEGAYFTTHAFPEEGSPMAAFLDAFESARGRPLETVSFGALAADAVILVADAFVRSGMQLDPLEIGDALRSADGVQVITGTVTFAGTNGVPVKPVYVEQVVGGEPTLVEKIEP